LKFRRRGIVPFRFAVLSRFGVKFVEVAGAGLASAACAYCLGQIGETRPSPPAPVVQIVPASEEALRMARDDHALLTALVRKEAEGQKKPEAAAAAEPVVVAPPKPAKPSQAAPARRNPKPEQSASIEPQPRAAEPVPIQPLAASNSAPKPVRQSAEGLFERDGFATSAPNGGDEEGPLLARLRQIPSWFQPDNDRVFGEVPRPPMPVGEFFRGPM
jgi:hypothetical protein